MKTSDITHVAVLGAGTMGAGIAGLFARAGCEVRLVDQSDELLERGMAMLRAAQEGLRAAKTKRTVPMGAKRRAPTGAVPSMVGRSGRSGKGGPPPLSSAVLRRVQPMTDLEEACAGVELVVEAISEDLKLKQRTFRRLDHACPPRAVLATNTSGLSITAIARATRRPGLVAGMHFWNPPHLVPLVEVVKGRRTADSTARLLVDVSRRLGKRPILVRRDVPGFVGNRLQFAVLREALHLLESGVASAEDIDAAMTAGPGLRYGLLGPLRTADLGGLDVFLAISRYLFAELNADAAPPPILADLVAQGRLGAKSGGGFYDYSPRDLQQLLAQRDRVLLAFSRVLGENTVDG